MDVREDRGLGGGDFCSRNICSVLTRVAQFNEVLLLANI